MKIYKFIAWYFYAKKMQLINRDGVHNDIIERLIKKHECLKKIV